jgi:SAM-dependent methyltransferase
MNELAVKRIYDELYSFESKFKKAAVYPIHKRLKFDEDEGVEDIYGWISKHVSFQIGDKVLDAGCGVGFGSCLLAKAHDIEVVGISLSEMEVEQAKRFAGNSNLVDRVSFKKQSFDTVEKDKYHKIIAIESIKHSLNLSKTLLTLKDALLPGGTLYIVEDFYEKLSLVPDAQYYQNDWSLVDVFRLKDYYEILPQKNTHYSDLTKYIPSKNRMLIHLKLAFNNILSLLKNNPEVNVNKIFRGGYYLDRLYLNKLMKYGILEYTKENKKS